MAYNCLDDSQKSPVFVDAEIGGTILGLSTGIYPKEVLSIFSPEGVHLCWTFKRMSIRGRALGVESITIHP